jgi:hypothetical protein
MKTIDDRMKSMEDRNRRWTIVHRTARARLCLVRVIPNRPLFEKTIHHGTAPHLSPFLMVQLDGVEQKLTIE